MIHFFRPEIQLTRWGPFIEIEDFLSPSECKLIVQQMPEKKLEQNKVAEGGVENLSVRSSRSCGLDLNEKTKWIFQKIEECVTQINTETYRFQMNGIRDAVQLIEYNIGCFYSPHMDSGNLQFSRRKLSISIQLTDESEYEGGELEFYCNGQASKKQGCMIIFPSYLYHEIKKITRGVRRSVVAWIDGNPYC